MAAPTYVGASTGVVITVTSGVAVNADIAGVAIGDVLILQILQDGPGASDPTASSFTGVTGITGTGGATKLTAAPADVGSPRVAKQLLWIGRATATTITVTVASGGGDDCYCRWYAFRGVDTGLTLASVLENATAGVYVNAAGSTAAITDTAVTTLGADRLALNFVAVDDDNPLAAFTGMTGGTWAEAVAEFASATGTDGAIQLQLGQLGAGISWPGTTFGVSIGGTSGSPEARAIKFTAPATGTIAECRVSLKAVGAPTDDLIVEIRANSGSLPSSTVVGTPATLDVTSTTFASYSAAVAAPVVSGTVYWVVVRRTGAISGTNHYQIEDSGGTGEGSATFTTAGGWVAASGIHIALTFIIPSASAGTIDGGTQTMAAADNWGVIGFALKPLPSGPATLYGATASPYTFAKAVAGQKQTYGATATPLTVAIAVAGQVTVPAVTHYGALAAPFAFNAATAAQRRTTGQVALPVTFAKDVAATRKTFGVTATPLTLARAVAATKKTFGALAAPYTFAAVTAGVVTSGAVTHYGALVAPFTFGEQTQATRKTFGQTANPYAFAAVIQGRRRTTSSISAPFVFTATHAATRKAFGQIAAPFVFGEVTQGRRRTTSSLVAPFTFTKAVAAQRRTTGQTATTVTFGAVVASRKQYARLTAPFVFSAAIQSSKKTYGVVARPITFGAVTAGIGYTGAATYFGATATTITFSKAVQGQKKTFGVVARPIVFAAVVQGRRTTRTQIAAVYTFAALTQAKRKTHATVAMPIQWLAVTKGTATVGIQTYYGVVLRPFTFSATTQAQRRTFSTTHTPITISAFTKGMLMAAILNYADDIRWGTIQADRVMVGTEEVWRPGDELVR